MKRLKKYYFYFMDPAITGRTCRFINGKQLIYCLKHTRKQVQFGCILTSLVKMIFAALFCWGIQDSSAQTHQIDTVGIIEKIVEEQDTMIRYPVPASLSQKWTLLQKEPIDSVFFRQRNTLFQKELYNLFIKNGSELAAIRKSPTTNSNLAAMDGRIIRRIEFDKVDIFAPSITDTAFEPSTWFERTVNLTHNDTRRKILQRYLLLKPGEPLDVFLATENERILRDLSFIMEARFVARQVPESQDSVDLVLLTQDMLPIGLEADMTKSTLAVLGVSHQNILGFGSQFMTTFFWDAENTPHFGHRFAYGVANLAGTFAAGKVEYTNKWDQESYVLEISRDFRSVSFKNAGGVRIENTLMQKNIELLDTTLYNVNLKYTITDLWAGRMVRLGSHSSPMSSGLFLTGRFNQYRNHDGWEKPEDYLYTWQDKTLLLFSAGFSRQGFRKDNLIYTFGRTEDVPFGYLFDVTSGVEWGQPKSRPYLSAGAAYGNYFSNIGYLYGQVKFGTFFNSGSMEQGALQIQMRYFSNLHRRSRFQRRDFATFTYLHGINRTAGEYTGVENGGGISGLTSQSMRGNSKMVLNLESVVFSPFMLLGFKFAFFGSADIGLITSENLKIADSRLFSGFGAGVRIRNDQLIFDTFVIKLAFYPGKPGDGIARHFIADGMPRLRLYDFFPYKPTIINYQ